MRPGRPRGNSADQRRISDIWLTLRIAATVFAQLTAAGVALIMALSLLLAHAVDMRAVLLGVPVVWLFSSLFIFRVLMTYHEGIVLDAKFGKLSFPASDIECGIVDIIMLKRFFDHGRRETIRLASIDSVMNETRARRGHYAVNVSGVFGSRQFLFGSKQKRDEFRAAVDWASRETGVSTRQDGNSDIGGYGG